MCKRRVIFYALAAALASPILLGVNCPNTAPPGGNPVPQTLLSTSVALTGGCLIVQNPCAAPLGGIAQTFNPTAQGKTITATATGSLNTSQPQVEIQDFNTGNPVANSGTPSGQTATASFPSIGTGLLFIQVCECGSQLSPQYDILITQAP